MQETATIASTLPPVPLSSDAAVDMDDSSSLLPPPHPSVSISASFASLSNTQPLPSSRGGQGLDRGTDKEMNDSSCSGGQSAGGMSADCEASKRLTSSPYRHANMEHKNNSSHPHQPLSKDRVLRMGEDVRGLGFDVDFSGSWRSRYCMSLHQLVFICTYLLAKCALMDSCNNPVAIRISYFSLVISIS